MEIGDKMIRKRITKIVAVLTSIVMAVSAVIAAPELPVEAASVEIGRAHV